MHILHSNYKTPRYTNIYGHLLLQTIKYLHDTINGQVDISH